jgi:hypothetical protein
VPAGATGVAGRPSDLLQRITMLLQAPQPVERRCPRLWSCAALGGLALPAVLVAGVGLQAVAAPAPTLRPAAPQAENTSPLADEATAPRPEPAPPAPAAAPAPPAVSGERKTPGTRPDDATPRPAVVMPGMPAPPAWPPDGRLGIRAASPEAVLCDQLDLPPAQGLVVEFVLPGSAAERGGLRAHDILLALDGQPVPADVSRFAGLLAGLPGGRPLTALVVRRGRRQNLAGLTLPEVAIRRPPALSGAPAEAPVATVVSRRGDEFTARYQDGPLVVTLAGTVTERDLRVREVTVLRGGFLQRYPALSQVPPAYRAAVRQLIDVSSQGSTRVRIHSS